MLCAGILETPLRLSGAKEPARDPVRRSTTELERVLNLKIFLGNHR